jgi:cytochrome c-type biogenesis protein CcmH/NrfG
MQTPFQTPIATRRKLIAALPAAAALAVAGCAAIPGITDSNVLLAEGEQLYHAKRYDEAITRFRTVIAQDPTNWRAWLWLARTYIVRGLWGDAIESGRQAFRLSPQGPEVLATFLQALFGGGAQALSGGNFSDAIKHFSEYLNHNTANPSAWLSVGKAYLGNKQYGDALQSLVRALGVTGADRNDVIGTIFSGGAQAFKERDFSSAINLLREYVKQDPRNLQAYLTLGKSYLESGQGGGALEAFREVLKLSPTNAEALQFLLKLR